MSHRHCPYCNSTSVIGLGAFMEAEQTRVELRCRDCGKLFVSDDRREPAKLESIASGDAAMLRQKI